MGEMTDRCFLRPRAAFIAGKINIQDAINLVVYAKLPLKSRLTGEELIAGSVRTDRAGHSIVRDGEALKSTLPQEFEHAISALRYPVGPSEYEPLLVEMLEAGIDELPFFVHEHNLLVDRRCRAALFAELYSELQDAVSRGEITVRQGESQQSGILAEDSWMSERTLLSYLTQQKVKSWWEVTSNLNSHDHLERILLNDTPQALESSRDFTYDTNDLPSFLFAQMLLRRTHDIRDLARALDARNTSASFGSCKPDPEFAKSYFKPGKRQLSTRDLGSTAAYAPNTREGVESETLATPNGDSASLVERVLPIAAPPKSLARRSEASDCATNATTAQSVERPTDQSPRGKNSRHAHKQNSDETPANAESVAGTDEDRMSKSAVAKLLGFHKNTVDNLRKKDPTFPKPSKPGGALRWRRGDLLRWLKLQES